MFRRAILVGITGLVLTACGASTVLWAAPKTYKYKCPKCGLIEEHAQPGIKKCPKDGRIMNKFS